MEAALKLPLQKVMYHTLAFNPGHIFEAAAYNLYAKMRLTAAVVPGMSLVFEAFVDHRQMGRLQGLCQRFPYAFLPCHNAFC